MTSSQILVIGPFRLRRAERLLTLNGVAVDLPARAVELLLILASEPGKDFALTTLDAALAELADGLPSKTLDLCEDLNEVLSKQSSSHYVAELAEGCLRLQGRVVSYFVQEVAATTSPGQLPVIEDHLVRRADLENRLAGRLKASRLVTLLGPGGVGKTTAALVTAHGCSHEFVDGVRFVDLTAVHQPGAVARAVLLALDWEPGVVSIDGMPPLEECFHEALCGKELLLVLDNCEHVVEEVTVLVELLLRNSGLKVLATSREPLRTFGEVLVQVSPLSLPPHVAGLSLAEARSFESVQMLLGLLERQAETMFPVEGEVELLCSVCRRLDGIPLALKLAAAHVPQLGVQGLIDQLDTWTAAPASEHLDAESRHRTLEATLNWSYALLSEMEQVALRRLSIFRGSFPLDSAVRVIGHAGFTETMAIEAVVGLQSKSLLTASKVHDAVEYRLLETTREYASHRLITDPHHAQVRRAHVEDCMARLEQAEVQWVVLDGRGWLSRYGRFLDDVWQATQWGIGGGDVAAGTELILRSLPMASRLGRFDDSHDRLMTAYEALARDGLEKHPQLELQLLVTLRTMALNTHKSFANIPGSDARLFELAQSSDDHKNIFGAFVSIWTTGIAAANYAAAAAAGEKLIQLAEKSGDRIDLIDACKHAAYAYHFLGDQVRARTVAERGLSLMPKVVSPGFYGVAQCDSRVSLRIVLARVQWMAGQYAAAERTADMALRLAHDDRPLSVCLVHSFVLCPMALWNGDLPEAGRLVASLAELANRHSLTVHQEWAQWYSLALQQRRSEQVQCCDELSAPPSTMVADMLPTVGCDWFLPLTEERVASGALGWCAPEVHRLAGNAHLARRANGAARRCFEAAVQASRAVGSRAWELRAKCSLAALGNAPSDVAALRELLDQVMRESDGFSNDDIRAAQDICASADLSPAGV